MLERRGEQIQGTPEQGIAAFIQKLAPFLIIISLGCGDSPSQPPPDTSPDTEAMCSNDSECNDGNACNGDESCDPEKGCVQGTPLTCIDDDLCNGDESCDPEKGCVQGTPLECDDGLPCTGEESCDSKLGCTRGTPPEGCCTTSTDCDDSNACNGVESCDTDNNTCVLAPALECDDNEPCNGEESCNPESGCVEAPPLECDDKDACNGVESCKTGEGCQPGETLICDDNEPCNGVEICDSENGCVEGTALDCDDKDACNGVETCKTGEGCQPGETLVCDDTLPCNGVESCEPDKGCVQGTPPEGCCTLDEQCNDNNVCNGVENCSTDSNTCVLGTELDCNDNNICTVDACGQAGCTNDISNDLPVINFEGAAQGEIVSSAVLAKVSVTGPFKKIVVRLNGEILDVEQAGGNAPGDAFGPFEVTVTEDGQHQIFVTALTCQGASEKSELNFTIDTLPPTLEAKVDPPPNAAGWNNSPVTVNWVATDSGTGVSTVTESSVINTQGKDIEVVGTAVDGAGLKTEVKVTINLDLKAPTATIDSPKPNQEGDDQLVVSSTTIEIAGILSDDNLSGFASGLLTSSKTKEKISFAAPGNYTETLELHVGINTVVVSATDVAGNSGTASICIIVDTTIPNVTIQYPPNGYKTVESTIDVSGLAQDLVVGSITNEDLKVTVNGVTATVDNGQFVANGVPLELGSNKITATATDSVGQSDTHSIEITRIDASVKHLKIVSGNNQSGSIFTQAADPLVVQLVGADGVGIADHKVVFGVTANDGTLSHPNANMMSPTKRGCVVISDADGKAEVSLTLGSRAGQAINRVTVSADGAASSVSLFASGTAVEALNIHAHAGVNQIGTVGEALPMPLAVVVTDGGDNPVSGQPVTFEVTKGNSKFGGSTSVTVISNDNGFADAVLVLGSDVGYSTHAITASIPTNPDGPSGTKFGVVFNASAFEAGEPAETRLRGRVLDEDENPVAGVQIRFPDAGPESIEVLTGDDGRFTYFGAPVGFSILEIDGSKAVPIEADYTFPTLTYEVHNIAGALNDMDRPIYMLRLNKGTFVDGLSDVEIGIKELPGFVLKIPAGTKVTFPDGSHKGVISITQVHFDQAPMSPIDGLQSRILVTIQPPGVHFDPPAPLTVPNVDNFPAAKKVEMFSFDHDLESFVSIGTGTVSDDSTLIRSDPGVGVVKGGWHCGADPQDSGDCESCPSPSAGAGTSGIFNNKVTVTASGSPGEDTSWQWEAECGNISVSGDSCNDQSSCEATVSGDGSVIRGRVKVTHICNKTGEKAETTVDVNACEVATSEKALSITTDSAQDIADKLFDIIFGITKPLGCKIEKPKFQGSAEGKIKDVCCQNCTKATGKEGSATVGGSAVFEAKCLVPGLSIPFLSAIGIKAGVEGSLTANIGANLSISGTSCCKNPPCVCASGRSFAKINGGVALVLSLLDGVIASLSGGVTVGVGIVGELSCTKVCASGCFNGLDAVGKVGFLNGFISATFTHPLVCPKALGGFCNDHGLNKLVPIGSGATGCGTFTDVCGNPGPPPNDPSKEKNPNPPNCGNLNCNGACVPNCGSAECGDDLCGGSCGTCPSDKKCENNQCICPPKCDGKACGPDGCGGLCGSCAAGEACDLSDGQCKCEPDCTGKACGNDGCGGLCGTCAANESCNLFDQCECEPDCTAKVCGNNGCDGSCGSCPADQVCTGSGVCEASP